jgi:hypothetical protein
VLSERVPKDSTAGRQQFERQMEERRAQETEDEFKAIRRGWSYGDEQFRQELLAQMTEQVGAYHYRPEVQESAEEKAHRIVAEELPDDDGRSRTWPASARVSPAMARRLRAETTMTLNCDEPTTRY